VNTALHALNDLASGAFLLCTCATMATRQIRGCLRFFQWQSIALVASALILALLSGIGELYAVAVVNVITKPIVIPIILRRFLRDEIYSRREISQAFSIPAGLLVAVALTLFAFFVGRGVSASLPPLLDPVNLPVGTAGLLLGCFTIAMRREASAQLFGLFAMENGAFFAGIALAPTFPLIAEIAAAFDALIIALVIAVLTRTIHERVGSTDVGKMSGLREERRT
jgi:hydrogenase-4 component E